MIKKHDVDSYLTLLVMPNKVQPQIAAIMALNVELATIRDKVTIQGNDTSALYRLQFWREAVQAIYGQEQGKHVPRQPAAIALCAFAPNANPFLLESLISARQGTIGDKPFSNVIELENYGKSTTGALIRLQCEAFREKSPSADENPVLIEVAEQIGASYAIANLLRSTLPLLTRRVVLLPRDALSHHSVTPDNVYSKKKPDDLRKVVKDLCLRSEQLYSEASKLGRKLNRQERLPVASFGARIDYILNTLEKACRNFL
ncbi:hypothetical protein WR25_16981 isoform A [Diploscapter pachys]|uniref:15-cis-phytoene synthase n=1 Tax=Diploscapter pachys TaxID=2018661 RepID=A0A2A2JKJ4_9BILA|nr:hypothetical protein WR25_16981 isoform A [Diploscapter pachys]